MRCNRDDDLLDFILAHHAKEERRLRCFAIGGRHICARCLGICGGLTAFLLLQLGGFPHITADVYFLLPVPAFIDWGGRLLGFFEGSKAVSAMTGILMGLSLPHYLYGILGMEQMAIASAMVYVGVYIAVSLLRKS